MPYVVFAYDGTDDGAADRRARARQAHLELFQRRYEEGVFLFGSALLDDAGKMIGSLVVADYPSLEALHSEWLDMEPYVVGDVWRTLAIHPTRLPPCMAQPRP